MATSVVALPGATQQKDLAAVPKEKSPIVTMRRVFKRLILRYDLCSSPRIWKIVLLATMVISPKLNDLLSESVSTETVTDHISQFSSVRSGALTIRISFVNL